MAKITLKETLEIANLKGIVLDMANDFLKSNGSYWYSGSKEIDLVAAKKTTRGFISYMNGKYNSFSTSRSFRDLVDSELERLTHNIGNNIVHGELPETNMVEKARALMIISAYSYTGHNIIHKFGFLGDVSISFLK